MRERRGFTLPEMLVTVGILFVATLLIIPSIQQLSSAAKQVGCKRNLKMAWAAWQMYRTDETYCVLQDTKEDGAYQYDRAWRLRLSAYTGKDEWSGENWFDDGAAEFDAKYHDALDQCAKMGVWDCPQNDLTEFGGAREMHGGLWAEYTIINSASNWVSKEIFDDPIGPCPPYPGNQRFGGNRFLKGDMSRRIVMMDGFCAQWNRATSLALFLWRTDDALGNYSGDEPFCYPHGGSHPWNGKANVVFGDGHVMGASYYEVKNKLYSPDQSGRDCEWFMDADMDYEPINYSQYYQ